MPLVTVNLLVVTVLIYAWGNPMWLALWPITSEKFHLWQLVSYAFVHGSVLHLLVNMLGLVSFGPALERAWGADRFLVCYLLAAAFGGVIQASLADRPVVGASAALFGLFAAYVINKPKAKIVTIVPWPLDAWKVLLVYALLTSAAWLFGWATSVAHAAHLGGMLIGVMFALASEKRNAPD